MTRPAFLLRWLGPLALLASTLAAGAAHADVEVRVQSRPVTEPIKAFVRVTTQNGVPVGGLAGGDFGIEIDTVAQGNFVFTLPAFLDPTQRLSVIFAIDYSTSVQDFFADAIQAGIATFIDDMSDGDYAAIVKFNATNPDLASVVVPFTRIDNGGAGDMALISGLMAPYDGQGTNLLDALDLAVNEFAVPSTVLPDGPKAIILISDGDDNSSTLSQSDVVANAHANGVAVFTVSVGDISGDAAATALMASLAAETGGRYFAGPDEAEIAEAYATVSSHLSNSYVLTIPQTAATECDQQYLLEIAVQGQTGSVFFTRCDTTPDDFHFTDESGVAPGAVVVSNTVSITGIDSPVEISVTGGEYSVGCGATFTSAPGIIQFEDEICVRHTASTNFSANSAPTVLVVGGVSSSFTSTTRAAPPPNNGGGGGATSVLELLFGLGVLLGGRRRRSQDRPMQRIRPLNARKTTVAKSR